MWPSSPSGRSPSRTWCTPTIPCTRAPSRARLPSRTPSRQEARPRGRGRLLAAHARGHLPPLRRSRRSQPLPVRDGQHPRALLLDPHRHGRGHREGLGHHQDGRGQGPPAGASLLQRGRGQQRGAGHRRRRGGHPGRARPGRRRPQGHHRGERDHHRWDHGQAGQDLPHHRLLGLHPHAAHGGLRAAREHHAHGLLRGGQGRGLRGQLHRGHPQEGQPWSTGPSA